MPTSRLSQEPSLSPGTERSVIAGQFSHPRLLRAVAIVPAVLTLLVACDERSIDPINLLALEGQWRYEMRGFSGSGASCVAGPAIAWGHRYDEESWVTGYEFAIDSLRMTCNIPGVGSQEWQVRSEGAISAVAWLYLDVYHDGATPLTGGCLLPTPAEARINGSVVTTMRSSACSAEVEVLDDRLSVQRTIYFRYPDTTNAAVYTLNGTAILRRP